jgi:putative two-component system response regulator
MGEKRLVFSHGVRYTPVPSLQRQAESRASRTLFGRSSAPHESPFGTSHRLDLLRAAARILVLDDDAITLRLITRMLHHAGYPSVTALSDAQQLEAQIALSPPDLVILDLHMPHRSGFEILERLRPLIRDEHLPVLVISGVIPAPVRRRVLALGARDFLTKPLDRTEMTLRVRNQLETRLLYQDVRKQNRALLEAIHGRTQELECTRLEILERLATAAEYRDDSTSEHTQRVGSMSARLAEALGISDDDTRLMRHAAALHDVGKIGIPDALLLKPAQLTEDETAVMRTHTVIGAHILGGSVAPVLQLAEVIALSHHERWDGTGYPRALKGEAIPLAGRIVAVADAFDALTNDRPYRKARSRKAGLQEIARHTGTQFDPAVAAALERVLPQLGNARN